MTTGFALSFSWETDAAESRRYANPLAVTSINEMHAARNPVRITCASSQSLRTPLAHVPKPTDKGPHRFRHSPRPSHPPAYRVVAYWRIISFQRIGARGYRRIKSSSSDLAGEILGCILTGDRKSTRLN